MHTSAFWGWKTCMNWSTLQWNQRMGSHRLSACMSNPDIFMLHQMAEGGCTPAWGGVEDLHEHGPRASGSSA